MITGWAEATLPNNIWVGLHNLVVVILGTQRDQGAMDTGFLKPMPLQVINQELSVPGLASTLNFAPVIFSAMWIAVSVWRVSGPHRSRDSPSASAMKIIILSWMYLSTVPPVSTASSNSSAAFFPTASPEVRGEPSADPPRMQPVLVRATTTIPDPLPAAALASSL